jgi:hypothetical protein
MTNTPVFNLLGDKFVGSTLQVDVGTIDDGASVSCSWESLGSYYNTVYSTSCSYTPRQRFSSGGLNVIVTVSKSGFASWYSGDINVGDITLRPMTNTPIFNLLGNRVVGSTLQVDVGTVDEGASISCSWDSLGSYNNTNFSTSCSYTPRKRFGSGGLNVIVTVSKSGFASWSSGYINVGAITN